MSVTLIEPNIVFRASESELVSYLDCISVYFREATLKRSALYKSVMEIKVTWVFVPLSPLICFFCTTKISNIGSLETRASTNISETLNKRTNLCFQLKWTLRQYNSHNFDSFSHKVWLAGPQIQLIKPNFCIITWGILGYAFRTILISCAIWKLMNLKVSVTYAWVVYFSRFAR